MEYTLQISKEILSPELYTLFTHIHIKKDDDKYYGYGICIDKKNQGTVYLHTGHIDSYNCEFLYIPDNKLSVIVLSNLDIADRTEYDNLEKNIRGFLPLWVKVKNHILQR